MRRQLPKPNFYERSLAKIAPKKARDTYRTRCAFAMAESYRGASKTRRSMTSWKTNSGDFNTDVIPELDDLRDRSQSLFQNNMLAAGAINTKVTSIVGGGLTMQSRIDRDALNISDDQADKWESAAEREWRLWSGQKDCSANRQHSFAEIQALALLSTLLRGDCFALTPEKKATSWQPYRLRVQLIEADRVCNEGNAADDDVLAGGIKREADGSLKEVHILKGHPGNLHQEQNEWDIIPFYGAKTGRRNVLHLYRSIRIGQNRGVPDLAPVIEGLKQWGELTQATVDTALVQTLLAVFIKGGLGGDESALGLPTGNTSTSGSESVKLETAAIIDLGEDEEPVVVDPTHPNSNYGLFATEFYRQIGTALEVPHELLIKHFSASYSAAQAALLEAWRFFMARRQWLAENLCQPVYELFLAEAISSGRLAAPSFFSNPIIKQAYCGADWVGPPRGHIREDVQNKADAQAEDRGWKTSAQNCQERNSDFERNHRQRVKEVKKRQEAGLLTTEEGQDTDLVPVDE